MYGVVYPGDPVRYFACLLLDDENADELGLEHTRVPAGQYAQTLVRDWESRISELPAIVSQLESDIEVSGLAVDRDRPWLEFYRRIDELVVMLPILPEGRKP
jgi:DNA gyrase inhibitor GyrI